MPAIQENPLRAMKEDARGLHRKSLIISSIYKFWGCAGYNIPAVSNGELRATEISTVVPQY